MKIGSVYVSHSEFWEVFLLGTGVLGSSLGKAPLLLVLWVCLKLLLGFTHLHSLVVHSNLIARSKINIALMLDYLRYRI